MPSPQIQGKINDIGQTKVEMIQLTPNEQIWEHIVEDIVDVRVPQVMGGTNETVKTIPQERVQNHTVEQIFDCLVPQVQEEIVEVIQPIRQEWIPEQKNEKIIPNRGQCSAGGDVSQGGGTV